MSPRKTVGTATERALARMLTENTGRHFLDSGGAYGRNWERQQGRTVADFLAEPEIAVEVWSPQVEEETGLTVSDNAGVTLSVFHYLRQRLEYNHADTMRFKANARRWDNDAWLQDMEMWAAREHDRTGDTGYAADSWPIQSYNSYNSENLLSQEVQFTTYTSKRHGGHMVILQIHGGADVRGGYTAPKVFEVTTDEPYSFLDWDGWSFGHDAPVTTGEPMLPGMDVHSVPFDAWLSTEDGKHYVTHSWEKERGSSNGWVEHGGSYVTLEDLTWVQGEDEVWRVRCPECGPRGVCDVYAPYSG